MGKIIPTDDQLDEISEKYFRTYVEETRAATKEDILKNRVGKKLDVDISDLDDIEQLGFLKFLGKTRIPLYDPTFTIPEFSWRNAPDDETMFFYFPETIPLCLLPPRALISITGFEGIDEEKDFRIRRVFSPEDVFPILVLESTDKKTALEKKYVDPITFKPRLLLKDIAETSPVQIDLDTEKIINNLPGLFSIMLSPIPEPTDPSTSPLEKSTELITERVSIRAKLLLKKAIQKNRG